MSDMNKSTSAEVLEDRFGREFPYLRLSITDVCNFRCAFCLPNGYQNCGKLSFLTKDEIIYLVDAFAEMGTHKIRITGGEPTVRKDFTAIAQLISNHPTITQTAFTTNGYRLVDNAKEWFEAGLTHINVSIDSLNAERFYAITGHDRLHEVRKGVEIAIGCGFKEVKINVVLLKGINDQEIADYLLWAKNSPISIRFIELMQTGENLKYFKKFHLSAEIINNQLLTEGWSKKVRPIAAGPAQEYTHPDYCGSIGIIAPYSKDFCKGCNRLRVTSIGDLRLCLFGNQGVSLRHLLQNDQQKPLLKSFIANQLGYKCSSHFLALGDTGVTPHLASVGG